MDNLPATGCTLRCRPSTILQPLPLRYLYQYVNFAVSFSKRQCKGRHNILSVQVFSKIFACSLTFVITIMLV